MKEYVVLVDDLVHSQGELEKFYVFLHAHGLTSSSKIGYKFVCFMPSQELEIIIYPVDGDSSYPQKSEDICKLKLQQNWKNSYENYNLNNIWGLHDFFHEVIMKGFQTYLTTWFAKNGFSRTRPAIQDV